MKTKYTVVLTGSLTQRYTTMFSCSAAGLQKFKLFLADIILNWYTDYLSGMTAEVAQLAEILAEIRHRLRVHIACFTQQYGTPLKGKLHDSRLQTCEATKQVDIPRVYANIDPYKL